MVVKEKVLNWLGLDPDFREQEETQHSYVDQLLGLAYPSMTAEEIKGLGSIQIKLKLLLGSLYLTEEPLSFVDIFRIFTRRELGFLILDLSDAFCDDISRFSQYMRGYEARSSIFERLKVLMFGDEVWTLDQIWDEVGLHLLVRDMEEKGYQVVDPLVLINRR